MEDGKAALDKKESMPIMPLCLKPRRLTSKPKRALCRPLLSVGDFVGRAAVSSLKIVCRNEEKCLTGKRVFVNMPFCLGREKIVCKATK
jgi:hypothetical protein